jgi:hypothetical protein
MTWVRTYIISSEITKSNSWRRVGGIKSAKSISEESTQSTSGRGHEKSKVQNTDSKGLQTGYLGRPHTLKSGKGLTKI